MKYKLLASDIDGTLINSNNEITKPVSDAIEKLKACGGIFTIATGRSITKIIKCVDIISPEAPVITDNGAVIIRADNGEIIYKKPLSPSAVAEIWYRGLEYGVLTTIWTNEKLYVSRIDELALSYSRLTGEKLHLAESIDSFIDSEITKCVWRGSAGQIEKLKRALEENPIKSAAYCISCPELLEFMDEGVSKGEGLKKVCEYCKIDISEAIAAGDEQNDIEMLKAAGLGAAMGNASDIVKAAADYIAPTNDENGLCDIIEKFML